MKIAMVTPYDLAVPGGVNSHALHLASGFRALGHDVRVIGPASGEVAHTSAEVHVLGRARAIRAGGSIARIALSHRLAHSVQTLLHQEAFDVVHLHEPMMPMLPLQFLRYSEATNIGTFHAAESVGRRLGRLAAPLVRRWISRLDAHIAVSNVASAQAERYLNRPCELIPNCIDVEAFARPAPPLDGAYPELREGRRTILFVGRQEPRKGLSDLLAAYGRLRAHQPNTQLLVVGPMSSLGRRYRSWVARQGWDDVVFTGAVSQTDLPRYYQAADLLCAPAVGGESFGLVLAEAMAAGLPIVASDIPGFRQVLEGSGAGVVVPPRDPSRLAETLLTLLKDAPALASLGAGGRRRAETFSIETVGRQVLAVYDRHLNGQGYAA